LLGEDKCVVQREEDYKVSLFLAAVGLVGEDLAW
jgi:hypothetical protein